MERKVSTEFTVSTLSRLSMRMSADCLCVCAREKYRKHRWSYGLTYRRLYLLWLYVSLPQPKIHTKIKKTKKGWMHIFSNIVACTHTSNQIYAAMALHYGWLCVQPGHRQMVTPMAVSQYKPDALFSYIIYLFFRCLFRLLSPSVVVTDSTTWLPQRKHHNIEGCLYNDQLTITKSFISELCWIIHRMNTSYTHTHELNNKNESDTQPHHKHTPFIDMKL